MTSAESTFVEQPVGQECVNADSFDGFSIRRLILIDSLSAGQIVELPVDGGAVLTGRNGRGKTSLLQLLPLFYGESPNRIVTAEAGRDSFIGYYLPRVTSYLAFEYMRPGGQPRMVVAYADRNGDRVLYRFVRHGFDFSQFVLPDGSFVLAQNFAKHLKLSGFECAPTQIESLADYRGIIQGVPSNTTDKQHLRHLRELSQDYSFTTTRQPLRQIEKIVSGMFRRRTNFDDLQSMVIDCVSDEIASDSISGDRSKIEDWPRGYKAYSAVMALAPKMDALLAAENHLLATEMALGDVRAKYSSLANFLNQESHRLAIEQRKQSDLIETETSQYQKQRFAVAGRMDAEGRKAAEAEGKAKQLLKEQADFEAEGIAEKDRRVRNAQALRNELPSLEGRHKAIIGAQSEVSTRYDRLKQAEKDGFNAYRDAAQQELRRLSDAFDRDLAELQRHFDVAERQASQIAATERAEYDNLVQTAMKALGQCENAVKHPVVSAEIIDLLTKKQESLEAARRQRDVEESKRRELEASYRQAKQAFADQELRLSAAIRHADNAEKELAGKRRHLAPEEGTLLAYLRKTLPQWSHDIAKVIRDDLLDRTDLAPSLSETSHGMYGLSIELNRLEPHTAANMNAAEDAVALAESRFKDAQHAVNSARQILGQLATARDAAEQACGMHEHEAKKAALLVNTSQADVEEAKRQVEKGRRDAIALATQNLKEAERKLKEARDRLVAFDQAVRDDSDKRRNERDHKRRTRLQSKDAEAKIIDARVAEHRKSLETKIAQYDAERDNLLRQQGIDTGKLKSVEAEMARINSELAEIGNFILRVQDWNHWKARVWPTYDALIAEGSKAREAEKSHQKAIAELDATWRQRGQQLQSALKQIHTNIARANEQRDIVRQRVAALPDVPDSVTPDYDPTWTVDSLTALANKYQQASQRLHGDIRKGVAELAAGFRLHQGTSPEQYLQLMLSNLPQNPCREWLQPFKQWFATEHQEFQRILLMEAVNIAGEVKAFHWRMDKFHRRVQQFNRELQAHLDTSLAFESISSVNVEVVSTITELKYWPAICEMAEAHRSWLGGASNDLPPPEFAQNIERLLDHWEIKTGIRADHKNLIRIQGDVTENGNRRVFKRASDLEAVSSNGLSYLVLATIFVAFINRIRKDANVNIVWALDELKDLDAGNVVGLVDLLERNNITLVSAFPDPDPDTLALFRHRFTVEPDRRLASVQLAAFPDLGMTAPTEQEASHV